MVRGGGGGGGGVDTPSENFNHCLFDLLLILSYRPILGLPEYKFKVVNIFEMHETGGIKGLVLCTF